MATLHKFVLDGWDYYQYCYAVKWHKDKYGDPASIGEARTKYVDELKADPPKISDFYDLKLTSDLIQKDLKDLLNHAESVEINVTKKDK